MAPRAAAFLALALLVLCALQGAAATKNTAADCEICKSDKSVCDNTGTQSSKNGNSFIAGTTTCLEALPLVTCGKCKNGAANAPDCCTLSCTFTPASGNGDGTVLTKCACGPPADNEGGGDPVGICGDPHLQGAYGVQYDFHGLPDKTFNLISDQGLSLNAYFIGQNGLETGVDGTWMSALGLLWTTPAGVRSATFTAKEGAAAFKDAVPFDVEVDNKQIQAESFIAVDQSDVSVLYTDDDITVAASPIAYSLKVTVKDHLAMIITAATHEHPEGNHIDIGISNLNVTDTVHGALGQTFAAARAAALKEATSAVGTVPKFDASDIVEGKDVDYMTSSLQSTDFVFNRFNPYGATARKANVISRKILGSSAETMVEELVQGELSCQAKANGGLRCYTV